MRLYDIRSKLKLICSKILCIYLPSHFLKYTSPSAASDTKSSRAAADFIGSSCWGLFHNLYITFLSNGIACHHFSLQLQNDMEHFHSLKDEGQRAWSLPLHYCLVCFFNGTGDHLFMLVLKEQGIRAGWYMMTKKDVRTSTPTSPESRFFALTLRSLNVRLHEGKCSEIKPISKVSAWPYFWKVYGLSVEFYLYDTF